MLICFIGHVKPVICLSCQIPRKLNCVVFSFNPLKISSCLIIFWNGIGFFFYPIRFPFWYSIYNNNFFVILIFNFGWISCFVFLDRIFVCDDFNDLLLAQRLKNGDLYGIITAQHGIIVDLYGIITAQHGIIVELYCRIIATTLPWLPLYYISLIPTLNKFSKQATIPYMVILLSYTRGVFTTKSDI